MKIKACVRSGACCRQAPCGFGKWNADKTQCEYLVGERPGEYSCGINDEIIKDPTSVDSPAFGSGCCQALFNESRDRVIKEKYSGVIPTVEVDNYW